MNMQKPKSQKRIELTWLEKFLYSLFPELFNRYLFRRYGSRAMNFRLAAFLFTKGQRNKRVDFFPRGGVNGREFDLVLDNKFLMRFTQNGDHFEMDEVDLGVFKDGKPDLLDKLNKS
mgnify:CR=1 FL=1|jgi:hypothetical protein